MYICVKLSHFVIRQRLAQHCKSSKKKPMPGLDEIIRGNLDLSIIYLLIPVNLEAFMWSIVFTVSTV